MDTDNIVNDLIFRWPSSLLGGLHLHLQGAWPLPNMESCIHYYSLFPFPDSDLNAKHSARDTCSNKTWPPAVLCETPGALYVWFDGAQVWSCRFDLCLSVCHIVRCGSGGGQTLISPPVCDLRYKGQMYVNPNSVFPQWWDGFVKRLMCPNPFKGSDWIQAVTPKCCGRKAELCFSHWDLFTGSAQRVHMFFTCWAFVLMVP